HLALSGEADAESSPRDIPGPKDHKALRVRGGIDLALFDIHEDSRRRASDGRAARPRAAARREVRILPILRLDSRDDLQAVVRHLLHSERGEHGYAGPALDTRVASDGLVGNPLGTDLDRLDCVSQSVRGARRNLRSRRVAQRVDAGSQNATGREYLTSDGTLS